MKLQASRPTRREIESAIGIRISATFARLEPTRDDLVVVALRQGAHPAIVNTLRALPDRRYRTARQLWADLLPLTAGTPD
jgi:hypothetical protein